MHRIEYIEKIGTGISRIKNAVIENGKSTVEFDLSDFFTVIFYRKALPKDGGLNGGLNDVLKELLDCIAKRPGIKIKDMNEILNRPIDTLDKQVKRLIADGLIERVGSRKTGGYQVKSGTGDVR